MGRASIYQQQGPELSLSLSDQERLSVKFPFIIITFSFSVEEKWENENPLGDGMVKVRRLKKKISQHIYLIFGKVFHVIT